MAHGRGDLGGVSRALGATLAHHVGRFFSRARQFVREAIVAGAMAFGGPEPLDAAELAEADRQAQEQVAYLDRFEADAHYRTPPEIAEGEPAFPPMSAPQFVARAEQYGGSIGPAVHAVNRNGVLRDGKAVRERRYHWRDAGADHPCATCQAESDRGWVPVGTLKPIGDSECLGLACDCYFVFALADGTTFITRRGWRRR